MLAITVTEVEPVSQNKMINGDLEKNQLSSLYENTYHPTNYYDRFKGV